MQVEEVGLALADLEAILTEEIAEANNLTGEAIQEALDVRRHQYSGEEDHCPICLEEFVKEEYIVKLDCEHLYHVDCIKEWLQLKNTCPICRQAAVPVV